MFWLIVAIFAVFVIFAVRSANEQTKILSAQNAEFSASHKGWDVYISPHNRGVIALNRETAEAVFGIVTASKRYRIADIASVEVLRDGASVTSTNRGSQAAGALIGGLAFGGVGMLLGGLSGSKRNISTIHSVAIKIIVDDREAPIHTIEFFKSPSSKGTDAHSPLIKSSLDNADHFHALLVNALRTSQAPALAVPNFADELSKLWGLRQAGALTGDEFDSQKSALLAKEARLPNQTEAH